MGIYYLDTEFNGFGGDFISIALVPKSAELPYFYGAVECPDPQPWVAENVIPVLDIEPESLTSLRQRLVGYLITDPDPYIIADWPEDIAHLTRLLITSPGFMVPLQRLKFEYRNYQGFVTSKASKVPHNALEDARALRRHALSL